MKLRIPDFCLSYRPSPSPKSMRTAGKMILDSQTKALKQTQMPPDRPPCQAAHKATHHSWHTEPYFVPPCILDFYFENSDGAKIIDKDEPAIRYADILLMYAEAINEVSEGTYDIPSWDGTKTHSIHRSVAEMRKGIKPVRMRAGVPDFDNNIYADKDVFRIYLKRERQIELMGEGKRYYDIRRWKDARVEEAMPVYGCNTLMTESDREMFHTPIAVWNLSATFSDKMWFWPISHGELKRNKRLTQNPGWTYND